jgi:hypothetical protein
MVNTCPRSRKLASTRHRQRAYRPSLAYRCLPLGGRQPAEQLPAPITPMEIHGNECDELWLHSIGATKRRLGSGKPRASSLARDRLGDGRRHRRRSIGPCPRKKATHSLLSGKPTSTARFSREPSSLREGGIPWEALETG